jgi:hypothetical protein
MDYIVSLINKYLRLQMMSLWVGGGCIYPTQITLQFCILFIIVKIKMIYVLGSFLCVGGLGLGVQFSN